MTNDRIPDPAAASTTRSGAVLDQEPAGVSPHRGESDAVAQAPVAVTRMRDIARVAGVSATAAPHA